MSGLYEAVFDWHVKGRRTCSWLVIGLDPLEMPSSYSSHRQIIFASDFMDNIRLLFPFPPSSVFIEVDIMQPGYLMFYGVWWSLWCVCNLYAVMTGVRQGGVCHPIYLPFCEWYCLQSTNVKRWMLHLIDKYYVLVFICMLTICYYWPQLWQGCNIY